MEDDARGTYIVVCKIYFNPRPPGGGRHWAESNGARIEIISIHVPRVEDDKSNKNITPTTERFQSTSPGWRTTKHDKFTREDADISIHVPRVEDDMRLKIPPPW